jgi:hypothetical protein
LFAERVLTSMKRDEQLQSHHSWRDIIRIPWRRWVNTLGDYLPPWNSWHEERNSIQLIYCDNDRQEDDIFIEGKLESQTIMPVLIADTCVHDEKIYAYHTEFGGQIYPGEPIKLEKSISLKTLADLFVMYPTLDSKVDSDWDTFRPNKHFLPDNEPDTATVRRMSFLRYLLEQGIFNEGFVDQTPPAYYPNASVGTKEKLTSMDTDSSETLNDDFLDQLGF